ncbi:MAG: histidine phosphatase family protein [Rhodospirillales bacterium]|nr:histidine phosphatase family protein [Rhodospirillales bacterium]
MRTIYLLRHGKSSWKDLSLDDFDRPLAKRGRRAAVAIGRYIRHQNIEPALILCSPSKRTRQTLDGAQEEMGATIPTRFERAIYMAEAAPLFRRLKGLSHSLPSAMIIGHNPGLEQLAALLIGDAGDAGIDDEERTLRGMMAEKFPTGALAAITADVEQWHDLQPGHCRLARFVRARDLISEG